MTTASRLGAGASLSVLLLAALAACRSHRHEQADPRRLAECKKAVCIPIEEDGVDRSLAIDVRVNGTSGRDLYTFCTLVERPGVGGVAGTPPGLEIRTPVGPGSIVQLTSGTLVKVERCWQQDYRPEALIP